jgi:hypothetical protein
MEVISIARIGWYVFGSALIGYAALQVLGRRAGSTAEERRLRMPGDELVPQPHILTNHAITIEVRPADVWLWLTQMGWHQGGYYTPEWVDRLLFPQNWPSLNHLHPVLLRNLEVGDTIPDGPPGTAEFVVVEVDAPQALRREVKTADRAEVHAVRGVAVQHSTDPSARLLHANRLRRRFADVRC